jgi:hypothetical protein
MEQSFKFQTEQVKSVENLKKMINADFIETVRLRFNDMFLQMKNTL